MINDYTYRERFECWYVLVPVTLYFFAVAPVNLTEIEHMPWGERLFYAEDPMGGRISFVDQNMLFTGPDSEI